MTDWKKIGWITGISAGSLTGLFFLSRTVFNKVVSLQELQKLSDKLQSIPSAMIHKFDLSGLTIRIDVKIKNPTANGFKMRYPFIDVVFDSKPIGSSQANDKVISIPPNGEVKITGIMLNFSLLGMLSVVGGLIKSIESGKEVKLNVTTTSSIDPLWKVDAKTKAWTSLSDYGIKKLRAIDYVSMLPVTLKKAQA